MWSSCSTDGQNRPPTLQKRVIGTDTEAAHVHGNMTRSRDASHLEELSPEGAVKDNVRNFSSQPTIKLFPASSERYLLHLSPSGV